MQDKWYFVPCIKDDFYFLYCTCSHILAVFDCGLDGISTPEEGARTYKTTTFGSVVTFECFDNFALFGESERTCQLTGWSNSNPTCGKEWMKCGSICERSMPLLRGEKGLASLCTVTWSWLNMYYICTVHWSIWVRALLPHREVWWKTLHCLTLHMYWCICMCM